MRPGTLLSLVLATALAPTLAHADDRPTCGESPSDAEVRARLLVLEHHVLEQEPLDRRWFTTFAFLHGAMAAGAGILAAQSDNDDDLRVGMVVNATSSTIGLLSLVIVGTPLMGSGGSLDAMSEATPEERLDKLRAAEDVLRRASNAVEFARGWLPAAASSVYTGGVGVLLLAGFGNLGGAFTHTIGGAIIGLGRLLLRPTGARPAWRRYRHAHPDAACEEPVSPAPQPFVRVDFGFPLGLSVSF